MADFTLLELHLHDSDLQFGSSSLRRLANSATGTDEDDGGDGTEADERSDASEESSGGGRLKRFVFMMILGAAAAAVKKLLESDDGGYDMDNVTDLGVVSRRSDTVDEEDDMVSIPIGDDDGRSVAKTAATLLFVAVVAFGVKKLLGDDQEADLSELEELNDVAAEP